MTQQIDYPTNNDLKQAQLNLVIDAASKIYSAIKKPVRILDLATGPNGFNPLVVRGLVEKEIDYELVLSDISPTHFKIGYRNLEMKLSFEELQKVKCVLADSRDLRRDLSEIPLWGEGKSTLEDVLNNPKYKFLCSGYQNGIRTVDFSSDSFDLVMGCIPYGSINTGDYADAINESSRVLREGGYHIVDEMRVEKIESYGLRAFYTFKQIAEAPLDLRNIVRRSLSAISRAKSKDVGHVISNLNSVLKPIAVHSTAYVYNTDERIPEQTIQNGDLVKRFALVHQK